MVRCPLRSQQLDYLGGPILHVLQLGSLIQLELATTQPSTPELAWNILKSAWNQLRFFGGSPI